MNRTLDVGTSLATSVFRLGAGLTVTRTARQPEKLLEVYEYEGCPFCRKVREALTMLDLDAMVFPCPRGGNRYRPEVQKRGGKAMFPYLVDPNTGTSMYESDAINRYLAVTYGNGTVPTLLALGPLTTLSSGMASIARGTRGGRAMPSRLPEKTLELWSYDASPYCRLVREALCELEIPYVLHNVARGSSHRPAFIARSHRMMVPYLADPNTGTEMFESADIVAYLHRTYGQG